VVRGGAGAGDVIPWPVVGARARVGVVLFAVGVVFLVVVVVFLLVLLLLCVVGI